MSQSHRAFVTNVVVLQVKMGQPQLAFRVGVRKRDDAIALQVVVLEVQRSHAVVVAQAFAHLNETLVSDFALAHRKVLKRSVLLKNGGERCDIGVLTVSDLQFVPINFQLDDRAVVTHFGEEHLRSDRSEFALDCVQLLNSNVFGFQSHCERADPLIAEVVITDVQEEQKALCDDLLDVSESLLGVVDLIALDLDDLQVRVVFFLLSQAPEDLVNPVVAQVGGIHDDYLQQVVRLLQHLRQVHALFLLQTVSVHPAVRADVQDVDAFVLLQGQAQLVEPFGRDAVA